MPAATATDCCRPSATTQGSFALGGGGWGEGEGISAETILSYGVYGWLEACGSVHLMLEVSVFALLPTQWSADGILLVFSGHPSPRTHGSSFSPTFDFSGRSTKGSANP